MLNFINVAVEFARHDAAGALKLFRGAVLNISLAKHDYSSVGGFTVFRRELFEELSPLLQIVQIDTPTAIGRLFNGATTSI